MQHVFYTQVIMQREDVEIWICDYKDDVCAPLTGITRDSGKGPATWNEANHDVRCCRTDATQRCMGFVSSVAWQTSSIYKGVGWSS
jgi:hypothetical protein